METKNKKDTQVHKLFRLIVCFRSTTLKFTSKPSLQPDNLRSASNCAWWRRANAATAFAWSTKRLMRLAGIELDGRYYRKSHLPQDRVTAANQTSYADSSAPGPAIRLGA